MVSKKVEYTLRNPKEKAPIRGYSLILGTAFKNPPRRKELASSDSTPRVRQEHVYKT